LERIELARRHTPLRRFLEYLNADDSLFATFASQVWSAQESNTAECCVFASRVGVVFQRQTANFARDPHDNLARQLAGLLEREPGEALRAELHVAPALFGGENSGFCLGLILYANGATPEQAQVRWGFGLARVQQALLFLSRGLRQQLEVAD
jgi:hypothetical protein